MVVLVTGSSGQLGQSIQFVAKNYPQIDFVFCDFAKLDITDFENCLAVFEKYKPDFCINTAAYTAVDKAESEPEIAHLINVVGAKNLAEICKKFDTVLLHISTDFVFDGTSPEVSGTLSVTKGYTEEDIPNPTGIYGQTKLDGEKAIQEIWHKHFIIRTSWVYSQFGHNFMKTMLRLAKERDTISVVNDQIGTPTNAVDLAETLLEIICYTERSRNFGRSANCHLQLDWKQTRNPQPATRNFGIYNFSNEGQCSWYDFAKKIFEINNTTINLIPIPTSSFPTPAKRPSFSVLDKSKIKTVFGIEIKNWQNSLKNLR